MTAILDIIEGARVVKTRGSITELTRVALIQVDDPIYADGKNILLALRDSGLPASGSAHPAVDFLETEGLVLEDFNVNMVGNENTIAQIEMVYRRPGLLEPPEGFNTIVSGGVALEETETQLNSSGTQITVEHNGVTQGGFVRVFVPRRTLRFQRSESSLSPGTIAAAYVGKTNSATWNSGAAGTWMCEDITFELQDSEPNPPLWTFTYIFRYKDEGWNPSLVFIDPETGQPPDGLVNGTGYKTITYYTQTDFNTLSL